MTQTNRDSPSTPPHDIEALPVREVAPGAPWRWLKAGWRDFLSCFGPSLAHGMVVMLAGLAIVTVGLHAWWLLPGAISGFLLVGPIVATGLYELSRRIALGERPTLHDAVGAWTRDARPLVWLGLGLATAATLWVLASSVMIALFVREPITGIDAFLRHVVLAEGALFPLWALLGGLGAAAVFALTVVSAPLLLDRRIDLGSALLTSVRAVGRNPVPLAVWATMIMAASALSLATMMIGFAFVIPVVGHASWHAYLDLVDASAAPPRIVP
jgi:uncharacterized membrane protein